jgi:hypothetical protein
MRKIFLSCMAICVATGIMAQGQGQGQRGGGGAPTGGNTGATTGASSATTDARLAAYNIPFNPDQTVTSEHEVTIKGTKVPYKTTAGMHACMG